MPELDVFIDQLRDDPLRAYHKVSGGTLSRWRVQVGQSASLSQIFTIDRRRRTIKEERRYEIPAEALGSAQYSLACCSTRFNIRLLKGVQDFRRQNT